jgi:hypothetical protein
MSKISVQIAPDFRGDKVVLVSMDRAGLERLNSELTTILRDGTAISHLTHGGITHVFAVGADGSRVQVTSNQVIWRLSKSCLLELLENLQGLIAADRPGHQYLETTGDADTLVLSVDEGY